MKQQPNDTKKKKEKKKKTYGKHKVVFMAHI